MTSSISDETSRNQGSRTGIATRPRASRRARSAAFWTGLAVVPAAIGTGVALIAGSRRAGIIAGGATALGLGVLRWQMQRWWADEPDFTVEQRIGKLELRRYQPRVEARTTLEADTFEDALDRGFHRLADYIFGNNRAGEELAMTAPVTNREKLAMTSPVISGGRGKRHSMAFVMPIDRTLASLPQPGDDRVKLVEVPEQRFAVLGYRGRHSREALVEHEVELMRLVQEAGLAAKGEPMFAGFDPPWTLPLIRRNEVWVELT
ncbi:MAG: heme-binding protein [Kofleriaceae bacterium]